jgi:hypothetical protein
MQKLDIDHVLFWMDAIRNSNDPSRTLESFWKGQIHSKTWLIDKLDWFVTEEVSVDIFGGWTGVLASLLFQSDMKVSRIRSIDIDPTCENTANTINKIEEIEGRFQTVTADMCTLHSNADVVINTVCEHITQDQYNVWLNGISQHSLIVLQSNNYKIDEHIRPASSLEEFKTQSGINVMWSGELELPLYTRYMIIGKLDV